MRRCAQSFSTQTGCRARRAARAVRRADARARGWALRLRRGEARSVAGRHGARARGRSASRRRGARDPDAPRALRRVRALPRRARVDLRRVPREPDRPGRVRRAPARDALRPAARRARRRDGVWVEPLACVLRAAERVPRGRVLVVGCGAVGRLWSRCCAGAATRSSRSTTDSAQRAGRDARTARSTRPSLRARRRRRRARALEPGGTLLVFAAPGPRSTCDAVYRKELTRRRLALGDAAALPRGASSCCRARPAPSRSCCRSSASPRGSSSTAAARR